MQWSAKFVFHTTVATIVIIIAIISTTVSFARFYLPLTSRVTIRLMCHRHFLVKQMWQKKTEK